MLDERKASILRAVVEEYIQTAQPVGSSHIASAPGVQVSSATVRNEMAALETEGFLAQPHTSAGRVPTEKGYRFFVDNLLEPQSLEAGQAVRHLPRHRPAAAALERHRLPPEVVAAWMAHAEGLRSVVVQGDCR